MGQEGLAASAVQRQLSPLATCGNGTCDSGETRSTCPQDCNLIIRIKRQRKPDAFPAFSSVPSQRSGDYALSLLHEGLTRTYKVHVPPSYNPTVPAPLVVYVHGGDGNARSAYLEGMGKASDTFGFVLAAPEGVGEVKWGELRAIWNGGRWAGGSCCGTADDVGFIAAMLQDLQRTFSIDRRRIYAAGISNGGLMTNRLACELSEQLAAVATVAPAGIPDACTPSRAIPVMDIHGTGDLCNPFDGSDPTGVCAKAPYKRMSPAQVVDTWRAIHGCSDAFSTAYQHGAATCVRYGQCRDGAEVEFCTVTGMGHAWPSGYQLPVKSVGPVSYDISFEQIWNFFQRHLLAPSAAPARAQHAAPGYNSDDG